MNAATSSSRLAGSQRARPLIAHVVYRFDVGGLENGVVNLINNLPPERYDHAVIALTDVTDFRRRIVRDDVRYHALKKQPGHGVAVYRRLYALFREWQPAIVHTRNLAASEAQIPAALARVPIRIHGEHGWDMHDIGSGKTSHRWQRKLLRPFVHRYVALSEEIRSYLTARVGVPADKIALICNGVDTRRFAPRAATEEARHFKGDGLFVVGTVGRLASVKNQVLLASAFVRACRSAPSLQRRLRLVIAGDGPARAEVEQVLESGLCSDLAWLPGERDDVPELMHQFDLFVLPSLAEGISNTILEAMASGRTTTQENFAAGDREVGLFVGYYSGQLTNGPLVTYSNTVVLVSDKVWAKVGERERAVEAGEHKFSVVETVVRGQGASEGSFLAWRWYWINDRLTDSDYVAKALTAFDKLTGRGDDSAVVVIYTPLVVDQEAAAAATLRAFLTGAEPAISERLAAVREQGRR